MIVIGDPCPIFELPNQDGELVKIESLLGNQNIVVYFYPKDDTPGCTVEACSFRDANQEFLDLGAIVIGISSDSVSAHKKFSNKHQLNFNLLADQNKIARKLFGVPTNLFGLLPGRVSYVINKKGIVSGIYNSMLDPNGHINKALDLLKTL
jgi:peroxiredoxin Q/BCP